MLLNECSEKLTLDLQHALGVAWLPSTDVFTFWSKVTARAATKRSLLATVMTVLDPLGLLVPWLLTPLVLVQELSGYVLIGMSQFPMTSLSVWNEWLEELSSVGDIQSLRYVFGDQVTTKSYSTHLLRCQ